jgi:hypothetical protein
MKEMEMSSKDIGPKWWQLYLTLPLLIALFVLDTRLKLSSRGHIIVQIGIVLLVYGLVHLWLRANAAVLSRMEQRQYHGTITAIQIPPSQLPEEDKANRSMLQFPDSEIRWVLSDTFDMDYIDAEAFPVDEVSQDELKKE